LPGLIDDNQIHTFFFLHVICYIYIVVEENHLATKTGSWEREEHVLWILAFDSIPTLNQVVVS
jgi:hypothetical protein